MGFNSAFKGLITMAVLSMTCRPDSMEYLW